MAGVLRVQVEPTGLEIAPGATGTVRARVVNGSDVIEEYAVDVVGADPAWVHAEPQRVSLLPGKDATVEVGLTLPAEHPPPAGTRVLGIRFAPLSGTSPGRVEEVALTITPAPAAELAVEPQQVRGRASGRFTARVSNRGNTPLEISLSGEDPERAVRVIVNPPLLQLRAGEQRQVRIHVSARREWTGPEVLRPLVIRARGGPKELAATVTFAQRSRIAGGLLRAATVLGAVVLIGGTFLAARLLVGQTAPQAQSSPTPAPSPPSEPAATVAATDLAVPPPPAPVPGAPPPTAPTPGGPTPPPSPRPTREPSPSPSPNPSPSPSSTDLPGNWARGDRNAAGVVTYLQIVDSGIPDQLTVHAYENCGGSLCWSGQGTGELNGHVLSVRLSLDSGMQDVEITAIDDNTINVATELDEEVFLRQ